MVPACCAHTSRARRQGWCEERCMGVAGRASHRAFGRRHVFRRKSPTASAPAQLERTWGAGTQGVDSVSVEPFAVTKRRVLKRPKHFSALLLTFISALRLAAVRVHAHRRTRHRSFTPKPRQHPSCRRGLELGPVVEPLRHHGLADGLPVRSELDPLPTLLAGRPEDLALQPGEGGLLLVAQALLHSIQV